MLIRSIRENPVSVASTRDPVERILAILSRNRRRILSTGAAVRQPRAHFKFLLARKRPKPARKLARRS